jgi:hypothetical protein
LLAVAVIVAGILSMASPAQAAMDQPVAVWQMNEAAGSETMVDRSGNGINGTIGDDVLAGTALSGGGTGYRFPFVAPNQPPANPERLTQVAHRTALNPGSGDYAVEFRMRTTHSFGNVVQNGQSGAAGGYFKFQQPNGKISCLFRGSAGSRPATPFPPDRSPAVRCTTARRAGGPSPMDRRTRAANATGRHSNAQAWL